MIGSPQIAHILPTVQTSPLIHGEVSPLFTRSFGLFTTQRLEQRVARAFTATQEVNQSGLLRSSPESVSPRSPDGLRMSKVRATVPADARLRTKNVQNDYSFFLLLLGANHSTIRPTDLRLSAPLQDAGIGAASRRKVRPMCRLAAARRRWSHGQVDDRTFQ